MRRPRVPTPASSCQTPAPKSAPPNTVYRTRPTMTMPSVMTSSHIASSLLWQRGRYRVLALVDEREPAEPPQGPSDSGDQHQIDSRQEAVADRYGGSGGHR